MFVSHRGKDEDFCGDWTFPCRSVRQAVNISSANDVIYIDYAEGRPYKECEHLISNENQTIILDKSLAFFGLNGSGILNCAQTYPFFQVNSAAYTTIKIVFSNLSLASRGNFLTQPQKYMMCLIWYLTFATLKGLCLLSISDRYLVPFKYSILAFEALSIHCTLYVLI